MKNLTFNDDGIKKEYREIIKDHDAISIVIDQLLRDNDELILMDIISDVDSIQIIIKSDIGLINMYVDYRSNKIRIVSPSYPYAIIYDNFPKKCFAPIGYEYQSEKRIIIKKNINKLNPAFANANVYELVEKNISYSILINDSKNMLEEKKFIKNLLFYNNDINDIRDLLIAIVDNLNIVNLDIKLTDMNNGVIILSKGEISKYIQYIKKENEELKIYLEEKKFYVNRTTKEEYTDNITPLVKKKGIK